ncbi:MAG: hypothetical protein JKY65_10800, partial [Planctomycetes bacterium]|nr:hypothetical protein [Planctomycetota bacterium]
DLERGSEALGAIAALPLGASRSILALEAMASGADATRGEALVNEDPRSRTDPGVARWRLLELAARPASLEDLGRAFRRARRAKAPLEDLRQVVDFHRVLAGFDWDPGAIWALGEDSNRDPRLAQGSRLLKKAATYSFLDAAAEAAFQRGAQRWLVRRLRFAQSRLHEVQWARLAQIGAELRDSLAAFEIRLLVMAGHTNSSDDMLPAPLAGRPRALLAPQPGREALLPQRVRTLLAANRLARGCGFETPAADRRRLLDELLTLSSLFSTSTELDLAETQALDVVKEAYMIEALRCTEEAWLAPDLSSRIAHLVRAERYLREAPKHFPKGWTSGDWRFRVAQIRIAIFRGDRATLLRVARAPWTDTRRTTLKRAVAVEAYLGAGDLTSAREAAKPLRNNPGPWAGLTHNQLLFLDDPPTRAPLAASPSPNYPFPWRSEALTQRLLESGWRPGQPLLPALGRGE